MLMLLQDEEWAQWSDREIGRQCAVSYEFVRKLRPDLSTLTDAPRTVSRGGTVYPMKPRGSSPKPAEPAPAASAPLKVALSKATVTAEADLLSNLSPFALLQFYRDAGGAVC